jgi:hypothetical protein
MANEFVDTLDTAADVAVASSKGLFRAIAIGAIPLIEFGAIIAITLLVVRVPLMLFDGE